MAKRTADAMEPMARYIIKGDLSGQEGLPIRDGDVIRGEALFYPRGAEYFMEKKSNAECPTYGNCEYCWKAGPVGNTCCDCGCGSFKVIYARDNDEKRGKMRMLDGERLAQLVGHDSMEIAMADRTFDWITTPNLTVNCAKVKQIAHVRYITQIKEEQERLKEGFPYLSRTKIALIAQENITQITEEEDRVNAQLFPRRGY